MSAAPAVTIGIDVGGTKIAAGVVDDSGTLVAEQRLETPAADADAVVAAIAQLVESLKAGHDVAAIGIGVAGFVDADRSTVIFAPNLAWRNEPLKQRVEEVTGLVAVVENDANAAAWGEFRFGGAADVDDMLCVTIGTGIGGGLVSSGQLYRGASGIAAEVGHLRVVPDGRLCNCGNKGCWEMYGSGRALVLDARQLLRTGSPLAFGLSARCGGDPDALTGPMVTAAAQDGDQLALDLVDDLGRWIGEGIASLVAVLDPGVVVVGGGLSEVGELLLQPVRRAVDRNLTGHGHRPGVEIRPASLGNLAGLVGAADLARVR